MSAPAWRLILGGARPGAWNMACDAALLERVGAGDSPPTLRFYAWDPPAVSLGRHQPEPDPEARAALAARGIDVVRRPTGGRAVWHGPPGEELTYAVAAPLGEPPLDAGIGEAYRRIHVALAAGLRALGADVDLAPRAPSRTRPDSRLACFAARVPHEIGAGGAKLLGSAQRRSRRALLQHGSLPLAGDQSPLREAWPDSLAEGAATTLSAAAGRRVGFHEAAAALAEAIAEGLNVRLATGVFHEDEDAAVAARTKAAPRLTVARAEGDTRSFRRHDAG